MTTLEIPEVSIIIVCVQSYAMVMPAAAVYQNAPLVNINKCSIHLKWNNNVLRSCVVPEYSSSSPLVCFCVCAPFK